MAHFTCGIERYLNFSFRIGHLPCTCRSEDSAGREYQPHTAQRHDIVADAHTDISESEASSTVSGHSEANNDGAEDVGVVVESHQAFQDGMPSTGSHMLQGPSQLPSEVRTRHRPYPVRPPPHNLFSRAAYPALSTAQEGFRYGSQHGMYTPLAGPWAVPQSQRPSQVYASGRNGKRIAQPPVFQPMRHHRSKTSSRIVATLVEEMESSASCLFLAMPLEVRTIVYEYLLVSKQIIKAIDVSGTQRFIMEGNRSQLDDIDSAILRTCRSIHAEASSVLYGNNRFHFDTPVEIDLFGCRHLANQVIHTEQNNGLTAIQKVTLKLGEAGIPMLRLPGESVDREKLWRGWQPFFEPIPDYEPLRMNFTALRDLTLDFSDWELDETQESALHVSETCSRIRPVFSRGKPHRPIQSMLIIVTSQIKQFVPRLRGSEGLRKLETKGVMHRQNLRDFRKLLVMPGGSFRALDAHGQLIGGI